MRLKNKLLTPAPAGKKPRRRFSPEKAAYYAFLSFMMFLMTTQPVYTTDVWTKAAGPYHLSGQWTSHYDGTPE